MTYDDLKTLAESRRSIRYFQEKTVDKQTLLRLLEIATLAPNIENTQPWHFHLILSKDLQKQMMNHVCYGNFITKAGAFIIVSCDASIYPPRKDIIWNPRELEYSCVSAMTFMMLAATSMGLGSCFVSLHHGKPHELLKISKSHTIVGGLMIGYLRPGEEIIEGSGHSRKPMEETYTIYE